MTSHRVLIALGSNFFQLPFIHWASQRLSFLLDDTRLSPLLWTKDIKGSGRMYMNRLITGYTLLSAQDLEQSLKQIEVEAHRTIEHITIDLDLMLYDSERYHLRDWTRPYITSLLPYMELADKRIDHKT